MLLMRMQKKFGGDYTLFDDAKENIRAIKELANDKIKGVLTTETQFAGRGSKHRFAMGKAAGVVPSFAKGLYDSDKIPGGVKAKSQILDSILSSGKRVDTVMGAAGSGKSTYASKVRGARPITSVADVELYDSICCTIRRSAV